MNKIPTVLDIVNWGTEYFEKHKISSPRLNVELMLCELLNLDRISVYTHFDKPLKSEELDILREWVKRRAAEEPLEYIFGKKKFCDISIELTGNVLIPRPETEQIIYEAEALFPEDAELEILDIGTGSGCIAIQLAKMFYNSKVYAIDYNNESLITASKNAELNNIRNVSFKRLNILDEEINYKFDLIVSNPPYISEKDYLTLDKNVRDYEPKSSLSDYGDGLGFYRRYSELFKKMLKKNGKFILESGFGQHSQVLELFISKGYVAEYKKDFSEINRICIGNFIA